MPPIPPTGAQNSDSHDERVGAPAQWPMLPESALEELARLSAQAAATRLSARQGAQGRNEQLQPPGLALQAAALWRQAARGRSNEPEHWQRSTLLLESCLWGLAPTDSEFLREALSTETAGQHARELEFAELSGTPLSPGALRRAQARLGVTLQAAGELRAWSSGAQGITIHRCGWQLARRALWGELSGWRSQVDHLLRLLGPDGLACHAAARQQR